MGERDERGARKRRCADEGKREMERGRRERREMGVGTEGRERGEKGEGRERWMGGNVSKINRKGHRA